MSPDPRSVHLPKTFQQRTARIESTSKKPAQRSPLSTTVRAASRATTATMSFSKKYTLRPPIRQQTQPQPNPYETPMQTLRGAQTVHMSPELFEKLFLASSRTANTTTSGLQSQSSFHHDDDERWRKPALPSPTPMYVLLSPGTVELWLTKFQRPRRHRHLPLPSLLRLDGVTRRRRWWGSWDVRPPPHHHPSLLRMLTGCVLQSNILLLRRPPPPHRLPPRIPPPQRLPRRRVRFLRCILPLLCRNPYTSVRGVIIVCSGRCGYPGWVEFEGV